MLRRTVHSHVESALFNQDFDVGFMCQNPMIGSEEETFNKKAFRIHT